MYNKRKFNKINDKKVLHKVKKQWVVLSLSMLAMIGAGGAIAAQAHASTVNIQQVQERQAPQSSVTNKQNNGKSASVVKQVTAIASNVHHQLMNNAGQKQLLNSKAIANSSQNKTNHLSFQHTPDVTRNSNSVSQTDNKTTYNHNSVRSQVPQSLKSQSNQKSNPVNDSNVDEVVSGQQKRNAGNEIDNKDSKNIDRQLSGNLKSSNPNIITGQWGNAPYKFNSTTEELETTGSGEVEALNFLPSDITKNVKSISFYGNTLYVNAQADFANLPNLQSIDLTNLDTSGVTDMSSMFYNDPKLRSVDFSVDNKWDTSNVTDMSWMFGGDSSLISIKLGNNFDTSHVTNMEEMFSNDKLLRSLNLSNDPKWNTSTVTDMAFMFYGDSNLHSLNLGRHFDTSNVVNMDGMFYRDLSLQNFEGLSDFNTSNVTNMSFMFQEDSKISTLDLSGFDTSKCIGNMADMFDDVNPNIIIMGNNTRLTSNSGLTRTEWYKKDNNDKYTTLNPQPLTNNESEPGVYFSSIIPSPSYNMTGYWGSDTFSFNPYSGDLKTTGAGTINAINNLSNQIPLQMVKTVEFAPGTKAPKDSTSLLGAKYESIPNSDGMSELGSPLANLSNIDCNNLDVSQVSDMFEMFRNDTGLKSIEFSNGLDTGNVNIMAYMFLSDRNLQSLDLTKFNVSNVYDIAGMFQNDYALTNLNLGNDFKTSKVTFINDMFNGDHSLSALNLGDEFNTVSVDQYANEPSGMKGMFANDYHLTNLDLGSQFYTSNVETSMSDMFANDSSLINLDLGNHFDTSNVKHMSNMFLGDTSLESLNLGDLFDTRSVSDMHGMFASDTNLQKLNLGTNFTTINAAHKNKTYTIDAKSADDLNGNDEYINGDNPQTVTDYNGAQNVFQNDKSLNTVSGNNLTLTGPLNLPSVSGQNWFKQTTAGQPAGPQINLTNGSPLSGTYGLFTSNQIVKTTLNFQDVNHGNQSIGNISVAGFSNTYIPDSVIANSLGRGYVPDISWSATINGTKMVQTFPNTPYKYINGTVNIPVKKDINVSNGNSSSVLPQQDTLGNVNVTYLNGSDQNEGTTNVTNSQLASLNTAAGMSDVDISNFLTSGYPASYKLRNSVNPIIVPISGVTSDVNVQLTPNVGDLTVDYMNGNQQVNTQQISASEVAKWDKAAGTQNVDITSSLNYPVSYKLQNSSSNNVTIPSLGKNTTVKINVLPNVGKLNVTYDYSGQPVASQTINSDDLATLKTKSSKSFNVPNSMLSFPASYKLHSNTNNATMPNVGQTGNATVSLDLNVGSVTVKYLDNGTQKGQTQTINASDVAKQRVASGHNLNITSLLDKDYPASYKLQNADDNSITVPSVGQNASDNISIVPDVGSVSVKYVEPGGQQKGFVQDLNASDLASLGAGPNVQNVDVTTLLNRDNYPQSYVLKNSINDVTIPTIGQVSSDTVKLTPNVGSVNVTYQYKGQLQGTQTIDSNALAQLSDAASTSNVDITHLLSGYPASYKLAGDTTITMPSKTSPLNINVALTPNIGSTNVNYNYNGQRGSMTLSASDLVSFNEAAGNKVNVIGKLGNLPAGYQLNQSNASDTLPALGHTNTINVLVKPVQKTDTINYVYSDKGTSRNEGSNRPTGDDSVTRLPDSKFIITNAPKGLHQGFNVINSNQSIPYDGTEHSVYVTPQTTSVNVTYKSGDSTVGAHTYTGPISATGLNSDQFMIGSNPTGLRNGYNVNNSNQNIYYSSRNVSVPVTPEKLRVPFRFETDNGTPVMSSLMSANPLTVDSPSDLQISSNDLTALKDKWYRLETSNNSVKVTSSDLNSNGQYVANPQVIRVTPRTINVPIKFMYNSHVAGGDILAGTMNHSVNVLNDSLPAGYQLGRNPDLTNGYQITPNQTDVSTGKTNPVTVNVTPIQRTDTIIYQLDGNSIGDQYRPTGDDYQTQLISSKFTLGRHPQGLPSGYYVQSPSQDLQYDGQKHYVDVVADQMKIPYRIIKSDKTNSDLISSQTSSSFTANEPAKVLFNLANVNNQLHAQGYQLSSATDVSYALTGNDVNSNDNGADTFNNDKEPSFTAHAINFNVPIQFEDVDNDDAVVTNGNNAAASAKVNQTNNLQTQIQGRLPTDYQLASNPSLSTFRFGTSDIQTGNQLKNPVKIFIKPVSHSNKLTFVYNGHVYGRSDTVVGPETGPEDNFNVGNITNGKLPAGFKLAGNQSNRTLQYSTSANQVNVTPIQKTDTINFVYKDDNGTNHNEGSFTKAGDDSITGLPTSSFKIGNTPSNLHGGFSVVNPNQSIPFDGQTNHTVYITPITTTNYIRYVSGDIQIGNEYKVSGYNSNADLGNDTFTINSKHPVGLENGYRVNDADQTINLDNNNTGVHDVAVTPESFKIPFKIVANSDHSKVLDNGTSTNGITVDTTGNVSLNNISNQLHSKGYNLPATTSFNLKHSDITNSDDFNSTDTPVFTASAINFTLPIKFEDTYDSNHLVDGSQSVHDVKVNQQNNVRNTIQIPNDYELVNDATNNNLNKYQINLNNIHNGSNNLSPLVIYVQPQTTHDTIKFMYNDTSYGNSKTVYGPEVGNESAFKVKDKISPSNIPNGFKLTNNQSNRTLHYQDGTDEVQVTPKSNVAHIQYVYNGSNRGSANPSGNDVATGLSSSHFVINSNPSNLLEGWQLSNPNQVIYYNGQNQKVAITPKQETDTIIFKNNNGGQVGNSITKQGNDYRTVNGNFNINTLSAPQGYQIKSNETLPYDGTQHSVIVTPDININVPVQLIDSQTGNVIVSKQNASNTFTVDKPSNIQIINVPKGYQLASSNHYDYTLKGSDVTNNQFNKAPLSFKITPIDYTIPLIFDYNNSIDSNPTFNRSTNANVDSQFNLLNYANSVVPENYNIKSGQNLSSWKLINHIPSSGNNISSVVIDIVPKQQKALVTYKNGNTPVNSTPISLGSGDTSALNLASSKFKIGAHPATLPNGYQIMNLNQVIYYNDQPQVVAVTPIKATNSISYNYNDHNVTSDTSTNSITGNEYVGQTTFDLAGLTVPKGYQLSANNSATDAYNNSHLTVNVSPIQVPDPIIYKNGSQTVTDSNSTKSIKGNEFIDSALHYHSSPLNFTFNNHKITLPNGYVWNNNSDQNVNHSYNGQPIIVNVKRLTKTDNIQYKFNDNVVTADGGTASKTGWAMNSFNTNVLTLPTDYTWANNNQSNQVKSYNGNPITIDVKPISKTDYLIYMNGSNKVGQSTGITGDDYQATLSSNKNFTVGMTPNGLPQGYHVVTANQTINFDGNNHDVAVAPNTEHVTVNFINQNGVKVGSDVIAKPFNTQTSINQLGNDAKSQLQSGYTIKPGQNSIYTFGINHLTKQVQVVGHNVTVPVNFINHANNNQLGTTDNISTKIGDTINLPIIPSSLDEYVYYGTNPSTYAVTADKFNNSNWQINTPVKINLIHAIAIKVPVQFINDGNPVGNQINGLQGYKHHQVNVLDFASSHLIHGYQLVANQRELNSFTINNDHISPVKVQVVPKSMTTTIHYEYNGQLLTTTTKQGLYNASFDTNSLSLPNGYNLANGNQTIPDNNANVDVDLVPQQKTDTINFVNNKGRVTTTHVSGNSSATGLASSHFTVGNTPNGLPSGYQVEDSTQVINYDGDNHTIMIKPVVKPVPKPQNGSNTPITPAKPSSGNTPSSSASSVVKPTSSSASTESSSGHSASSASTNSSSAPESVSKGSATGSKASSSISPGTNSTASNASSSSVNIPKSNSLIIPVMPIMPSSASSNNSGLPISSASSSVSNSKISSNLARTSQSSPKIMKSLPKNKPVIKYARVTKALALHTNRNFTKKNAVKVIKPGTILRIEKAVKNHNGALRYEVYYNKKNYFITANRRQLSLFSRHAKRNTKFYHFHVKVLKALRLHTGARFTKHNGVKVVYPGTECWVKRILEGHLSYEVNYHGHDYFITASPRYTTNAYLQKNDFRKHGYKAVKVIRPAYEYTNVHFSKKCTIQQFRRGTVLPVRRVVVFTSSDMTRLQLTNGRYLTANKDYVKIVK